MAYLYDLTDTWNAAGTVFNAIKMNVTNSASAAGSKIVSLQVGSTDRFTVDKDGNGYFSGTLQAVGAISFPNAYLSGNSGTIGMQDNTASILAYNGTGSGGITNTLRFITGASERLRIDGSGNIGIGTASPGVKLDVVGAGTFKVDGSGTTTPLILRNNNTASVQAVKLGFDSSGAIKSSINAAVYGNDYMTFNVGSDTERMRIDGSGNLGLGTTSPSSFSGYTSLTVNNATNGGLVEATTGGTRTIRMQSMSSGAALIGTVTNHDMSFMINGGVKATIGTSGNFGIGTASPNAKLEVYGANNLRLTNPDTTSFSSIEFNDSSSAKGQIWCGNGSYASYGGAGSINYSANSGPHVWYTNYSERMRIDSSGNVGINTSSPGSYKLNVQGATYSSAYAVGSSEHLIYSPDASTIGIRVGTGGPYYGIGTTGSNNMRFNNASGGDMLFAIAGTTYATLQNTTGNFGIGTSSPSATLSVVFNSTAHNGMRVTNNSTTQYAGSGLQMLGPSAAGTQGGAAVYYYNTNAGGTNGALGIAQVDYTGNFQRNLAYYDYSGQYWGFLTNGTERMRITSAGNVGIGMSLPVKKLDVAGAIRSNGATSENFLCYDGSTTTSLQQNGNNLYFNNNVDSTTPGAYVWRTTSSYTESMRITSSGSLLVGTTSGINGSTNRVQILNVNGGVGGMTIGNTTGAAATTTINFVNSNGFVGSITTDASATAYNTSSDYRLKDIDGPIQNSGAYIDALKPVQGSWKADGSRFIGLIAHEVQEVSETQIATGVKDGEEMQAMDYSAPELIANLIAEIQSLRARVAQLEGN